MALDPIPYSSDVLDKTKISSTWHRYFRTIETKIKELLKLGFIDLRETPKTYVGQASKLVAVKADESGLEFVNSSGGGSGTTVHNELTSIQGGNSTERYHLSNAQYTKATTFLNGGSSTHTDLDAEKTASVLHRSDLTKHFTQAEINHNNILNKGINTHAQLDNEKTSSEAHRANGLIHFEQADIDHTAINNIGIYDHDYLDSKADEFDIHATNVNNPHSVTANQVLPSQSGNSGKYLKTDGLNTAWDDVEVGLDYDEIAYAYTNGLETEQVFSLASAPVATIETTYDSHSRPSTVTNGVNTWTLSYNSKGELAGATKS